MTDHSAAQDAGELLAEDVEAFRRALAEDGLADVEVHDQIESLVASAADAAFWALVGAGSTGFLAEFGKLQAQNIDSAVKRLMSRLGRRRRIIVSEPGAGDRAVQVVITPDLPEAAYRQLEGQRPEAPSGRLVWDEKTSRWKDSLAD